MFLFTSCSGCLLNYRIDRKRYWRAVLLKALFLFFCNGIEWTLQRPCQVPSILDIIQFVIFLSLVLLLHELSGAPQAMGKVTVSSV